MPTEFTMKALTTSLRDAAFDSGSYYSQDFKSLCPEYHKEGRNWTDSALKRFFAKGLLQHYVATLSGYDVEAPQNYSHMSANSTRINPNVQLLFIVFAIPLPQQKAQPRQWVALIAKALAMCKEQDPLLTLGANFQRLKQALEHLQSRINATTRHEVDPLNTYLDQAARLTYQIDACLDRMQHAIYNAVRYFIEEIKDFFDACDFDVVLINKNLESFKPTAPTFVTTAMNSDGAALVENAHKQLDIFLGHREDVDLIKTTAITTLKTAYPVKWSNRHNDRLTAVCGALDKATSVEQVSAIIDSQVCLFSTPARLPPNVGRELLASRWSSSDQLKNRGATDPKYIDAIEQVKEYLGRATKAEAFS